MERVVNRNEIIGKYVLNLKRSHKNDMPKLFFLCTISSHWCWFAILSNNISVVSMVTDTSDAGIIAGGVIGGLAALILIILLVYFLVLRRKSDGESCKYNVLNKTTLWPWASYIFVYTLAMNCLALSFDLDMILLSA